MDQFEAIEIVNQETTIFLRRLGNGPPLLLLHGFPQTHLMWRYVGPMLAKNFTVVCPDLRGYGRSGCPPSDPYHTPYSKRIMANDMVWVMEQLGFTRFLIAGHDRGGRVAYRLALDYPERVERLSVLDIVPTVEVWDRADKRFAESFWPWSLLSQPEPLPEQLIAAAPEAIIDNALSAWGSSADTFQPHIKEAYIDALRNPSRIHAICEEYRAGATLDYKHDNEDRVQARRIHCPLLVLWSADGAVDTWYQADGGPLALWRKWAGDVQGSAIKAGHFFPEEAPEETANALLNFFSESR